MNQGFEAFVTSITQIYRCIQKIKAREMKALDLKSTHVMCLFQMQQHPEGLTAAQLSTLCGEDKGAVSRALSELEARGLAAFADQPGRKRYRTEITRRAACGPVPAPCADPTRCRGQAVGAQPDPPAGRVKRAAGPLRRRRSRRGCAPPPPLPQS